MSISPGWYTLKWASSDTICRFSSAVNELKKPSRLTIGSISTGVLTIGSFAPESNQRSVSIDSTPLFSFQHTFFSMPSVLPYYRPGIGFHKRHSKNGFQLLIAAFAMIDNKFLLYEYLGKIFNLPPLPQKPYIQLKGKAA
jgi:hypothetical protein